MNESHAVRVVRITDIKKHPNADRLEIIPIGGYQCVVGIDQFRVGDLAIYIQPDSVVPQIPNFAYVWEKDGAGQPRNFLPDEEVPEKYRRVTVRKLRKEWSEGLLVPYWEFFGVGKSVNIKTDPRKFTLPNEGDDVADLLNITHYNPPEPDEVQDRGPSRKQSKVWPRSLKGCFYFLSYWLTLGLYNPWGQLGGQNNEKAPRNTPPIYDVEALKNHPNIFEPGEEVIVSEKIHGANARYIYQLDSSSPDSFVAKGHMFAGSRRLWKRQGNNTWRKILEVRPDVERWCRNFPGYTLYGEAVPTQKSSIGTEYSYGATKEEPDVVVFDVRDPVGNWVHREAAKAMTGGYDIQWAPGLYAGPYDYETIAKLAEGQTKLGGKHIREGIVIRSKYDRHVPGLGRLQLKLINPKFYETERE